MAVGIVKWLKLHAGSRIDNRVVTNVQGHIGRDEAGALACGKHYQKLRAGQGGRWSCPASSCSTRIETKA